MVLVSCAKTNVEDQILGRWEMSKVLQTGKDVTDQHNPERNRFINFNPDGTFESGGDPFGPNTGKYSFDEKGNLYLDSDAGPDDDSSWLVNISENEMIWKGLANEFAREFELRHQKVTN